MISFRSGRDKQKLLIFKPSVPVPVFSPSFRLSGLSARLFARKNNSYPGIGFTISGINSIGTLYLYRSRILLTSVSIKWGAS